MFCGFANENKFLATHCSCYEFEILWEKIFAVMHRPTKILSYTNIIIAIARVQSSGGTKINEHMITQNAVSSLYITLHSKTLMVIFEGNISGSPNKNYVAVISDRNYTK